eukprot:TRINITY_DN76331_c0_g1_i1.p1 TRINITY_DN76331_c0_g1~~TRINITY_DN76331_c0_g1_i1.p1  ORF type:complete len:632 (+),score=98.27 TRINITY_DN76331_c0_g1_i1:55-1950(+)
MVEVAPTNVDELIKILEGPRPFDGCTSVRFESRGKVDLTDTQTTALAAAVKQCSWLQIIFLRATMFGLKWSTLLPAIGGNPNLLSFFCGDCGIQPAAFVELSRSIVDHANLACIVVPDNEFDEASVELLVEACRSCQKTIKTVLLSVKKFAPVTGRALQSMAAIARRSPNCVFGQGPKGRIIQALVATAGIENPDAAKNLSLLQEQLLDSFSCADRLHDKRSTHEIFNTLKDVSGKEQARILGLMGPLVDKACLIGGMLANAAIKSFEDSTANRQHVPASVVDTDHETDAIHFLLATAAYKNAGLKALLHHVMEALRMLEIPHGFQAVEVLVEAFFTNYKLDDDAGEVSQFKVSKNGQYQRQVTGTYVFHEFLNGKPAYKKSTESSSDVEAYLYFDGSTQEHKFDLTLGSRKCILWASGEQLSDQMKWASPGGNIDEQPQITKSTRQASIKAMLTSYLQQWQCRAEDSGLSRLLLLRDQHAEVHQGPMKNFARALEKARQCEKWGGPRALIDLNRATFVFDSPIIMGVAYQLIEKYVKIRNGLVTRTSNYFFSEDGSMKIDGFKQPPCVHMNVKLDDWIYEIMLMPVDLYHAKDQLHKMYDLARAEGPFQALAPVFEPQAERHTIRPPAHP